MPGSFIDSNVILYSAFKDEAKAARAESLAASGAVINVQVLNEVANVLRRKRTRSWQEVIDFLATLRAALDVRPLSIDVHAKGLSIIARYGFATYDAMIVAAAIVAECDTLWSEDMQNGLVVEGALTIRNPFASGVD